MRVIQEVLIDTDTLSMYMRREPQVVSQVEAYIRVYGQLNLSLMTYYEVLRGLKSRGATTGVRHFRRLCRVNNILPLTEDIVEQAADIYANLHVRGELIGEVDTLIAATALIHDLVLVTNNERHFKRVSGLKIENWLK